MLVVYLLPLIVILLGVLLIIYANIKDKKRRQLSLKKHTSKKFAVLIPARNESAVIEDLLKSLEPQMNLKDAYIIVEKATDKTCKIAQKYGANTFVRKVTKNTRRKGYALDECLKQILKSRKKYDLYFIFDADNIAKPHFIEELLITYEKGYQIGTGYRNIKNNDNTIATCSGLTFSMINSIFNELKMKRKKSIIITGTGYYIDAELIKKWNGFPFHSLTEDYELSLYCSKHHISTYYNKNAEFFDEQPTTMKTSIKQRTRWVKGFLESRKNYIKSIKNDKSRKFGILPFMLMIIGFILFLILSFVQTFIYIVTANILFKKYLAIFFIINISIYLILFVFTYIIVIKDIERLNMPGRNIVKALFVNPIFLITYIICLIRALKEKDLEWEVIDHNKTMS